MAYEIEAKAWVDDWEATEENLRGFATFEREFSKADRYFAYPGVDPDQSEGVESAFRLRSDGEHAYVTFKRKELRGATEFNYEREFVVDDPEAFADLAARISCVEHFAKRKRGLHFSCEGITLELVRVEGLGDFLEVEAVIQSDDPAQQEEAAAAVLELVLRAGLPRTAIERRSYMHMLRSSDSGASQGRELG